MQASYAAAAVALSVLAAVAPVAAITTNAPSVGDGWYRGCALLSLGCSFFFIGILNRHHTPLLVASVSSFLLVTWYQVSAVQPELKPARVTANLRHGACAGGAHSTAALSPSCRTFRTAALRRSLALATPCLAAAAFISRCARALSRACQWGSHSKARKCSCQHAKSATL